MHKPIQFTDLNLSFPHKTCFSDFSGQVIHGNRIAIIGRNGEGKSSLLKIFHGSSNSGGCLTLSQDLRVGYLPQIIDSYSSLSGGERLNAALTAAFCQDPNFLLLDEPTNHLDTTNRRALINHLRYYSGTLIIVTHDREILNTLTNIIWHIQNGKVRVFNGRFEDYQRSQNQQIVTIEQELASLKQQKKEAHHDLMREQERNKRKRINGEKNIAQRKWPTIRSAKKLGNAVKTGDKRLHQINEKKQTADKEWSSINQNDVIIPQFQLSAHTHHKSAVIIRDASVGYINGNDILQKINFQMHPNERIAICGANGSGKSTFIRAILNEEGLRKTGDWTTPPRSAIGYLDQHYENLEADKTVFEMLASFMPTAFYSAIRKHLNDFIFRKNEEINAKISSLSGGEKTRLSLCCIAASPPALLILDEMTNNLDFETQNHVIQVLKNFPGAMLIISHDPYFLKSLQIETAYLIHQLSIELINELNL